MTTYTPYPHAPEFTAIRCEKPKTTLERPVVKRKVRIYGRKASEVRSIYKVMKCELVK